MMPDGVGVLLMTSVGLKIKSFTTIEQELSALLPCAVGLPVCKSIA